MVSIPVMVSIVILGALGASVFACTQRENHSREISRLQQNHSDQLARLETAHAREVSILRETIEARLESAYRSGRSSARPHVFKGEEQTGSWFWKTKRDLTVAVVLDEDGNVLAFAGDGSKIHSVDMPSEVKKAIAALSGPVGKVLASVLV
jgi:hypothetical protein